MPRFNVRNIHTDADLGTYDASTEIAALDAAAQRSGYESDAKLQAIRGSQTRRATQVR